MSARRRIGGGLSIWRSPSRISLRSSGLHGVLCDVIYERKVIYGQRRHRSHQTRHVIYAENDIYDAGDDRGRATTIGTTPDAPLRLMMTKVIYGVVGNRKG